MRGLVEHAFGDYVRRDDPTRDDLASSLLAVGDDELAELFRVHLPRGASKFPVRKLSTLCHSLLLPDGVCERHAKSMIEAGVHDIDEEDFLALVADMEREAEEGAEAGGRSPTRRQTTV